jgi:predicted negative regulator of RcsB-dependent stress response
MAVELYDEHEQGERVRSWLRQNGAGLVFAVVLALGSVFGYRQWQDHQVGQQALGADLYQALQLTLDAGQLTEAEAIQARLVDLGRRSGYAGLGAMLMASAYVEDGQLEAGARAYRTVLAEGRWQTLWPVARLRLARVLVAQSEWTEALQVLGDSTTEAYRASWAELRGDALMAQGQTEAARAAYREALLASTAPEFSRQLLQTKYDATGPGLESEDS